MKLSRRSFAVVSQAAACIAAVMLTGCAALNSTVAPVAGPVAGPAAGPHAHLQGTVFGGQQPVAGSSIALYAAGTTGYSKANTNLLTAPVFSATNGSFNITGLYTCASGQQMYIVATGGNPGSGINANITLVAALGDCSTLTAASNVNINEITTVAAAYALASFANISIGPDAVSSSAANTAGLVGAFVNAAKLANPTSGTAGGPSLAPGANLPTAEINTLGNILAACVNTTGGTAGDSTPCGQLFTATRPAFNPAPADTFSAAVNIARLPGVNVADLFNLSSPTAPFQPQLASAPNDRTISINYTLGGFSAPAAVVADANGRIYFPNAGNNTVTVLNQSGTPAAPLLLNGLSTPSGVAIDQGGNIWVANKSGNTVSAFTQAGLPLSGSPFNGAGNLSGPVALAFDAPGSLFVANSTGNSVTQLTGAGAYVQQITTGITAPNAIAIDPKLTATAK